MAIEKEKETKNEGRNKLKELERTMEIEKKKPLRKERHDHR